jgi:hypothetical protein
MNLSCGNCKAIRSFSGEPPTCDECGWVAAALHKSATQEVRSYLKAHGTLSPKTKQPYSGKGWTYLGLIAVAGLFYLQAQDAGYISQSRTMDVAMKTSWMIGEYKTCFKALPSAGAKDNLPEILTCDDDPAADVHVLKVDFYGDPDSKATWNCRRVEDSDDKTTSLTCKPK